MTNIDQMEGASAWPVTTNGPMDAERLWSAASVAFSICTLVTNFSQYRQMISSFKEKGFSNNVEFIYIDNSKGNNFDAYEGVNLFLNVARGEFIIICHQDVVLEFDGRDRLEAVIAELEALDPAWAAFGNAGGVSPGRLALRISDPHGEDSHLGELPCKTTALDENFIVVKRRANLSVSRDLAGFHLYGADLCALADIAGHSCYVADFHLRHLSGGLADERYAQVRESFRKKYARAFRSRWVTTTCGAVYLSGGRVVSGMMNASLVRRAVRRAALISQALI